LVGGDGITIDALPGAAALLEPRDGRVVASNAAFERWATGRAVRGSTLAELFPGDAALDALWRQLGAGATEACIDRHRRVEPDGTATHWMLRASLGLGGVLLVAFDVTEATLADEALRASANDYVGIAAHELRGPLSAIRGWAGAVGARVSRGEEGKPGVAEALAIIARQVDRMSALLTDLAEVACADAGNVTLDRRTIGVLELVEGVLARAPLAPPVVLAPVCPGTLQVDVLLVELALQRLLEGAARRGAVRPVEIGATRVGDEVHLTLVDDAPLPAGADADPFARFARPRRRHEATGLGLHVTQLFAVAHGGRIWVEPAGDRTRFVLSLPAAPSPRADAGEGRGARVLVLDALDARAVRRAGLLRRVGHDAMAVADRAALLAELDRRRADIALVDAGHGVDLVEALRARVDPPEVVLIGAARPGTPGEAERAGARAVLVDPLDLPHLLSLLGAIASSSRALHGA
jgi:signal transduction histidine kinase/CheY-like chemotaxis protein